VVDGGNYALRNGSLTNTAFRVASNGDVSLYEDTGTTAKFFWDASAESLMLNATSRIASETLTVNGTVTTGGGTAAAPALAFRADSNTGIFRPAAQSIGFSANGSEAMRIDSSGNLLVDKTAIGLNTVGFEVRPNGIMASTRDGGSSAFFNRKTSDGSVVEFQKDGTTVGSIATGGGSLDVYSSGASNVGLRLSQAVIPMLNGAASPNTVDLGTNTREFKDLYLSGGVYLGGTGAANLLDDYEEGTWTPAFSFSTSGSVTYSDTTGAYTKVGRMVCVSCSLVVSSISSPTGNVSITGLPFTSATTGAVASAAIGGARNFVNSGLTLRVYNNPNSTSFVVATNDTDAGHAWLQGSNFTATTTLFITATYFV
jgi:hypothetical protein